MDVRRADTISLALERMIVTGEFADGERLDEIALAARFGVSRTPVREALQRLASTGLAEQIPRRGVFIRHPGPVELVEMFEVMAELEAMCGRLAATLITDAALDELVEANARCLVACAENDTDGYYDQNEVFHHIIYTQSGNSFLAAEAARLHKRLKPFRRMQLRLRGRLAQSMAEHDQVVVALKEGRAEDAAQTLRTHVAVQGEKFHHLLSTLSRRQSSASTS